MTDAHTHGHGREVLGDLAPLGRELRALIPGVYEGFNGLHSAAFADGEIDRKTKELIALAIAISVRCDGCIASHARAAAQHGATEAEVAETIGVSPRTVDSDWAFARAWLRERLSRDGSRPTSGER